MPNLLERNQRTLGWGYWIAVAVGFAMAFVYIVSSCTIGSLCH